MAGTSGITNKIVKVKAKDFTIKVLRTILMQYIESGPLAWTKIKDTLEDTVYKIPNRVSGEYGYLGIKYDEIRVGSTYKNWLFKQKNLRNQIAYNKDCINAKLVDKVECRDGQGIIRVLNGDAEILEDISYVNDSKNPKPRGSSWYGRNTYIDYAIVNAEIFKNDADVLFFSVFKQYEDGIEWKDRVGAERLTSCPKRISYMRTYGTLTGGASSSDKSPSYWNKPPLYPGVGFPAIGSKPNWYQEQEDGSGDYVFVYLSRTKHNVSVFVNYRKYWEMAKFGFFEPFDTVQEYPFPAIVMSSNSGARPEVSIVYDERGNGHTYPHFSYDYSQSNFSMGHSMPCCLASYWDGKTDFINTNGNSPVQFMTPKGQWKSLINIGIRNNYYYNKNIGFFQALKEPEYVSTKNYTTVWDSETYKAIDGMKSINGLSWANFDMSNIDDIIQKENTSDITLQPIIIVSSDSDTKEQNMIGAIPHTYWCSSPIHRYGLYKKDDDLYLIVPNIIENRQWHLNSFCEIYFGKKQTDENVFSDFNRIDEISKSMNTAFCIGKNEEVILWRV